MLVQGPPGLAEAGSGRVVKDAGCLLERGRALREQPRAVRLPGERGARIAGAVGSELAVQVLQREPRLDVPCARILGRQIRWITLPTPVRAGR